MQLLFFNLSSLGNFCNFSLIVLFCFVFLSIDENSNIDIGAIQV